MSKFRQETENIIKRVNRLRDVDSSTNLNEHVERVVVLLTGSRGGSSLMKTVLSKSNDIAYLSGEEEPYYIITGNGFPWNSDSDRFITINNKELLLDCIFDELGVNTDDIEDVDLTRTWRNRLLLQFPTLTGEELNFKLPKLINWLEDGLKNGIVDYQTFCKIILENMVNGGAGYYDIISYNSDFTEKFKIEEPPLVVPELKRKITRQDLHDRVLLFKTPQDCYRIGIFEQLFPNADIKYVHLTRGFAQSVNGLIDGWMSDTGFFAHNMNLVDEELNIEGYTNKKFYGRQWWKFDLPPNWRDYKNKSLPEVCLNQWHSAHKHILDSDVKTLQIKFEDFITDPQGTLNIMTDYISINPIKVGKLPKIMTTKEPKPARWKARENIIMELSQQDKVKDMMNALNYTMKIETWV